MEIVRTWDEISKEIEELELIKEKVKKTNNAGDPNRKIIDAEIHFLNHGVWIHENSWVFTPFSKQTVKDWLTNRSELSMSFYWQCAC